MGTSQKKPEVKYDPALVHFGERELCDMHMYLQRDLCALTGVECDIRSYSYEQLTVELPTRFRAFNLALISADGSAILEWCQSSDPANVKTWVKDVSTCIRAPRGALESRDLRLKCARAILAIRQYYGFASRLTISGSKYADQCREAKEKFIVRVTRKADVVEPCELFPLVGEAFFQGFSIKPMFNASANIPFLHGPGAVAEKHCREPHLKQVEVERNRELAFSKLPLDPWYGRAPMSANLDDPHTDLVSSERSCFEYGPSPEELPSRVVCVPKDYRGPRVIAAMTAWKMYIQSAFDTLLRQFLKRSCLRKAVDLNDQSFNQEYARQASMNLRLATADLSDASDSIHFRVVSELLRYRPDLMQVVEALRAGRVTVGNAVVEMTAAFTMGERFTFPLETVIFCLEIVTAYIRDRSDRGLLQLGRITPGLIAHVVDLTKLRAYGDDLLFTRSLMGLVERRFAARGYLLNLSKCCYRGFFREACGGDFWMGENVTPLRPRQLPGASEQTLSGHVQTITNLASKGLVRSALYLYSQLAKNGIVLPIVPTKGTTAGCVASDELYWLADKRAITVRQPRRTGDYQRPFLKVVREVPIYHRRHFDLGHYWNCLVPGEHEEYSGDVVGVAIKPTLVDNNGVEAVVISKEKSSCLLGTPSGT